MRNNGQGGGGAVGGISRGSGVTAARTARASTNRVPVQRSSRSISGYSSGRNIPQSTGRSNQQPSGKKRGRQDKTGLA